MSIESCHEIPYLDTLLISHSTHSLIPLTSNFIARCFINASKSWKVDVKVNFKVFQRCCVNFPPYYICLGPSPDPLSNLANINHSFLHLHISFCYWNNHFPGALSSTFRSGFYVFIISSSKCSLFSLAHFFINFSLSMNRFLPSDFFTSVNTKSAQTFQGSWNE